eukprot:TRINITY_DN5140_c0_g1_i7.p1 TRINITY_DN5140_c0_g1~~TRINITY_DN5140_c0_g1_i7.p1  ORF type:complete len:503 (+),score=12.84 TRINITY_DN5140_c0_g1_i7:122-1630(+)
MVKIKLFTKSNRSRKYCKLNYNQSQWILEYNYNNANCTFCLLPLTVVFEPVVLLVLHVKLCFASTTILYYRQNMHRQDEKQSAAQIEISELPFKSRSIEEISQSEPKIHTTQLKLPGQNCSHDNDIGDIHQTVKQNQYEKLRKLRESSNPYDVSSDDNDCSSEEFDIDKYREKPTHIQKTTKVQTTAQKKITDYRYIKSLKFMGIEFEVEKLLERNKDPILYLKIYCGLVVIVDILTVINFVVGLNFQLIPTILTFFVCILLPIAGILVLNTSVKDGLEPNVKIGTCVFLVTSMFAGLFVYSFVVNFPFNSASLFLLATYLTVVFREIFGAFGVMPNFTSPDDPNYQLKFLGVRMLEGFFNGTGMIDSLSDLVLGLQLVQQTQHKILLVVGIILIVLCVIDHVNVLRKIFTPEKITLKQYMTVIFMEILIMAITTYVLYGIASGQLQTSTARKDNQNEDTLIVVVISLMTTLINFLHHLFRVFFMVKQNKNSNHYIISNFFE